MSVNHFSICHISPSDHSHIFSKLNVKMHHFRDDSSAPPSHKPTYARRNVWSGRYWWLVFFLSWSQLVASITFISVLNDLVGYFEGQRLKHILSTSAHPHKRTYSSDGVSDLKPSRLIFSPLKMIPSVEGIIFMFVLINLGGHFSRVMVKIPNCFRQRLHIKRHTGQRKCRI